MTLRLLTASVLLLVGVSWALVVKESKTLKDADIDSRLFIVSVKPETCTTTSATYTTGTCYKSAACSKLGGTGAGSCALGFGTCCYFNRNCGSYTVGTTSTFSNPTTTTSLACTLEVRLVNDNICQLRLDFTDFELAPPNADGECATDSMTVTGTANDAGIPTLCGSNTGQHMYIDVDPTVGNPTINIDTGSTAATRSWAMNVEQIACDSADKAPDGCIQYYTATTDVVESFNYVQPTEAQITAGTATVHLNNQQYRVCVDDSASCIQWTENTEAEPYAFLMSDSADAYIPFLGTEDVSMSGAAGCPNDYVLIPGSPADRYCGLGFPDVVSSSSRPFGLYVMTDGSETLSGDAGNAGFSLRYTLSNTC